MNDLNATPGSCLPVALRFTGSDPAGEPAMNDWARAVAGQHAVGAAHHTAEGVFQPLSTTASNTPRNDIDMVLDTPVQMTVEPGRTRIAIRNLPPLAQGEIVNDKSGIRLTGISTPSERIRKLNR